MLRQVIARVKVYTADGFNDRKLRDKGKTTEVDITNFKQKQLERWLPHIVEIEYIRK